MLEYFFYSKFVPLIYFLNNKIKKIEINSNISKIVTKLIPINKLNSPPIFDIKSNICIFGVWVIVVWNKLL